uniref:Endonuclease/exonuclease/phosphatase domain-containing protein n=1 Tax=Acrobeloides nanus TaxID=290746 RepID=A0A914DYQ2_9BILA
MTFNIWLSGGSVEDGQYKIAKHIKIINPDIVALEEVESEEHVKNITAKIGPEWTYLIGTGSYPDTGIVTRHKFLNSGRAETHRDIKLTPNDQIYFGTTKTIIDSNSAIGTQILLDNGITVSFWALHLDYKSYGPYAAYNKLVTKKEQIMAGEDNGSKNCRSGQMHDLVTNKVFQAAINNSNNIPVFVCGDFNGPSHLDWNDKNKDAHGGWIIEWPATKQLMENAKMTDSFREIHPDIIAEPGYTWSTVQKFSSEGWNWTIPEPQDRIDFIFYRSSKLKPTNSFIYGGLEPLTPIPNHKNNDYPSDHYAVVTDFDVLNVN